MSGAVGQEPDRWGRCCGLFRGPRAVALPEEWSREAVVARSESGKGMTRPELHMLRDLGYIETIPPREPTYDEKARRVTARGFPEVLDEVGPESTREEWKAALQRAQARRAEEDAGTGVDEETGARE